MGSYGRRHRSNCAASLEAARIDVVGISGCYRRGTGSASYPCIREYRLGCNARRVVVVVMAAVRSRRPGFVATIATSATLHIGICRDYSLSTVASATLTAWSRSLPPTFLGPGAASRRGCALRTSAAAARDGRGGRAAIAAKRHLVAEAGTGVGKSFAYLVPAILAATEREAAAAKTRASSMRDSRRDRPRDAGSSSPRTRSASRSSSSARTCRSSAVIPREFSAVLVKGRGNYLSLRRLDLALARSQSLFPTTSSSTSSARFAVGEATGDGSLSDLTFQPLGQVWDEVASDSGNCLGRSCPTYNQCFYYRARRRAQNAQILVVNHALLLQRPGPAPRGRQHSARLRRRHPRRSPHRRSVAGDHLGLGVTSGQVEYLLNKLYNDRTNKGLLVHTACARSSSWSIAAATWPTSSSPTSSIGSEPAIAGTAAADSPRLGRGLHARSASTNPTSSPTTSAPSSNSLARQVKAAGKNSARNPSSRISPRPTTG